MDSVHSFIGIFYHSTHSAILLQLPLSFFFVFFFNARIYFNLVLCGCTNVSTYVCRYVSMWVMFILPTLHNPLKGYFSDEAFQLHHKDLDTNSQKISLLWAYGKFWCSSAQNLGTLCFMICSKDIFQKHFRMMGKNGQTPVILTIYIFFQRSSIDATGSFRFLPNSVQG